MLSFMPAWIWVSICSQVSFTENTIDYPTHTLALNINAAAVKRTHTEHKTQTHSKINRRPRAEGGGRRNPNRQQ